MGNKKWRVHRQIGGTKMHGGYFSDLENAKRNADQMVIEYEIQIGKTTKHKLNYPREKLTQNTIDMDESIEKKTEVNLTKSSFFEAQKRKRIENQSEQL